VIDSRKRWFLADFPATPIDPVNILARSFIGGTAPPPQASWLTLLSRGESLVVRGALSSWNLSIKLHCVPFGKLFFVYDLWNSWREDFTFFFVEV
jgi:hypothetical protein